MPQDGEDKTKICDKDTERRVNAELRDIIDSAEGLSKNIDELVQHYEMLLKYEAQHDFDNAVKTRLKIMKLYDGIIARLSYIISRVANINEILNIEEPLYEDDD